MKKLICIAFTVAALSLAAFADIARPDRSPNRVVKPVPSTSGTMTIRIDPNVKQPTLRLPASVLSKLRAENDTAETELNTASAGTSSSRLQTLMTGMLLSFAIVFGGVWVFRKGRNASGADKAFAIMAAAAIVAAAASFAYADLALPEARAITNRIFNTSELGPRSSVTDSNIRIERSTGREIELLVPDTDAPAGK
ncbi:MAG: hypothetical protein IT172_00240 [Acidobacteria bacterium]|nr:hypothetical protein [Acidobacteriota bacterium]